MCDFFPIRFSTFWHTATKYSQSDLKNLRNVLFGGNLTQFECQIWYPFSCVIDASREIVFLRMTSQVNGRGMLKLSVSVRWSTYLTVVSRVTNVPLTWPPVLPPHDVTNDPRCCHNKTCSCRGGDRFSHKVGHIGANLHKHETFLRSVLSTFWLLSWM